jgi:hypothetical protein
VSTPVDAPPRSGVSTRRGRLWWLVPEVVVLLALAVGATQIGAPATPAQVRAEVAQRAAKILEGLPPTEHHDHGHDVQAASRVVCGVEPFGYDPADAGTLSRVRTVYATFLCASGPPGTTFDLAYKFGGPVVIELGDKPVVKIPPPGASYRESVLAMMPERYKVQAFAGFTDKSIPASVVQRFNALSASPQP